MIAEGKEGAMEMRRDKGKERQEINGFKSSCLFLHLSPLQPSLPDPCRCIDKVPQFVHICSPDLNSNSLGGIL